MPAKSKPKSGSKLKSGSKSKSGPKRKLKPDSGDGRIELIARGLIRAGDYILLCRHVRRGYHYLPGGHVEFGEAASTALERELVEECGLQIRAGSLVLVTEERFNDGKVDRHEINLVFHVEHRLSGGARRAGSGSGGVPAPESRSAGSDGPPPPVLSREPKIAFDWVELRRASAVDLRPGTIKRWVGQVAASGIHAGGPSLTWIASR